MDFLSVFKKKKYSPDIEEIHNDFLSTEEKKETVIDMPEYRIKKSERLSSLGFSQSREIAEVNSIKKEVEKIKLIEYAYNNYRIMYPFNKFISYETTLALLLLELALKLDCVGRH